MRNQIGPGTKFPFGSALASTPSNRAEDGRSAEERMASLRQSSQLAQHRCELNMTESTDAINAEEAEVIPDYSEEECHNCMMEDDCSSD